MRKGVIGLSLLLILSLVPAYSATPPKAGSVCSKQGTTKTYQGKKYTCLKSGKKLVWSKGVVVKRPTPTPTPTLTQTPSSTPTPTPSPTLSPAPIPTLRPTPSPTPTSSSTPRDPQDVRTVTIRYKRNSGDYSGWNLWIWRNSDDNTKDSPVSSTGVPFESIDDYGARVTLTIDNMRNFKDIGFIVRLNEWQSQEFTDRFITQFDSQGFAEIYLIQNDQTVYLVRPEANAGNTAYMSAGMKAALDNLAAFPKSKVTPQALNYNFGPNSEKDISNTIKKSAEVTMQFFVDFYQDTKPYQIFYGSDKDLDWLIAEWRKYGYAEAIGAELFEQSISNTRRRTGPTSVMIGSDNRLPQTPMILLASRSALENNKLQISTIHHVVHGVQGRITGGKDLLLGCWGREGAAQFYGWAIMDRNFKTIGGTDYATERREQSKPMFPWNAPKTNLLEFSESQWLDTLKLLEGGPRYGNQIYCNLEQEIGNLTYSSGALLYERLVGEFGHQKVIDWWYEIRTTSDWKVAFEKVFKLKVDDWYKQSAIPYLMKEYQAWR